MLPRHSSESAARPPLPRLLAALLSLCCTALLLACERAVDAGRNPAAACATTPALDDTALVAPDGSVWADGWDGVADSDCCFSLLNGSTVVTFTHTAALPVPPALQTQIKALRR